MQTIQRISIACFLAVALAFVAAPPASAQTALSSTTLSQAISGPDPAGSTLGLVGGTANSLNNIIYLAACNQTDMGAFNRVSAPVKIVIDRESMDVQLINTTTCGVSVLRGVDGTAAVPHASGAVVYLGTPDKFATWDVPPGSACTAGTGAFLYTPRINLKSGVVEDCVASRVVWSTGLLPGSADPQVSYAQPYSAISTFAGPNSVAVNEATDVSGQFWFSQIFIPANVKLTGACQLNGNGTLADKMLFVLWDDTGAVLANTALAGVTQSGTAVYQCQPFVTAVNVTGPRTYFIGAQGNGTTAASLALYASGSAPTNYGTGTKAGTFGTLATITPTVTFTANKGPIMTVY
jgi:hypothetical protein